MLLVLALIPAVVLGTVSVEAMLIHDHHGHDLHVHDLPLDGLSDWRHGQEHDHDDRDHDRLPEQLPDDDGTNLVIVLELPDAILRVRGLSTGDVGGTRIARSLPLVAMDAVPTEGTPNWRPRPGSAAPDLRADRTVAGILLTSHALLL